MQIRCPVCDYSREANLAKVPPTAEFATCPKCRHRFRFRAVDLETVEQAPPPGPDPKHADVWDAVDSLQDRWKERDGETPPETSQENNEEFFHGEENQAEEPIPWEAPHQLGYGRSFTRTTLWAMLHPSSFFALLPRRPALIPALSFYLILGFIQYVCNVIWTYILSGMVRESFVASMGEEAFEKLLGGIIEHSLLSPAVLSVPFQLAIQLFLTAAVVHLLIRLISPQTADFTLAFKVVAYAGASFCLALIPVAGAFIAPVWYFALLLIGCRSAFALPWNKAILAMTPLYLLLFFVAAAQYSQFFAAG